MAKEIRQGGGLKKNEEDDAKLRQIQAIQISLPGVAATLPMQGDSELSRKEHTSRAKLAEQCERYDQMARHIKAVVRMADYSMDDGGVSNEERNLFAVAHKNVIGVKRGAWRIATSIAEKSEAEFKPIGVSVVEEIASEMAFVCNEVLELLETILIPGTQHMESRVEGD